MKSSEPFGFPTSNVAEYVTVETETDSQIVLTGEKGYKTALASYGVKHGDYYFEVEVLAPKVPLPFIGVKPALRVGLTTFKEQDLELPIGASTRSYTYTSTGRMVTNQKYPKEVNESFCKLKNLIFRTW